MKLLRILAFAALLPALALATSEIKRPSEEKKPEAREVNPPVGAIQQGVYFIEPKAGAKLTSPFTVKMGVHGMIVKPAGQLEIGTGHHHLIINDKKVVKAGGIPEMGVVPADENNIHFGKGEEEYVANLPVGKHTLTLQFADGAHRSFGPKWSKTIQVTVVKSATEKK